MSDAPARLAQAFVTGASGFVGRALVSRLAANGCAVLALDQREPSVALPSNVRFARVDLFDSGALEAAFASEHAGSPEHGCVFHLAAQSHVGACRDDPRAAYALNVGALQNVLEACRATGLRKVVYPSTSLVYARPRQNPISQLHPTSASSIYTATKLAAESLLSGYAAEYGFACSVARLGNVYGAGSHADSITAIVLRQALAGGPIALRNLAPVRDFIYRDDVCAGLIALAGAEAGFGVWNLASGRGTSVGELAEAACAACGSAHDVRQTEATLRADDDTLILSVARMAQTFAWQPQWSLEAGLRACLAELSGSGHGA